VHADLDDPPLFRSSKGDEQIARESETVAHPATACTFDNFLTTPNSHAVFGCSELDLALNWFRNSKSRMEMHQLPIQKFGCLDVLGVCWWNQKMSPILIHV
jgi:hypothetical protein